MRYERLSDLPAAVRTLPPEAQVAWMDAYNRGSPTTPNPREAAAAVASRTAGKARGMSPGVKKVVWTALVTLVSAASAALAVRAAERAWRRMVHEDPPSIPAWARFLVGNPVRKQVAHRLTAGVP